MLSPDYLVTWAIYIWDLELGWHKSFPSWTTMRETSDTAARQQEHCSSYVAGILNYFSHHLNLPSSSAVKNSIECIRVQETNHVDDITWPFSQSDFCILFFPRCKALLQQLAVWRHSPFCLHPFPFWHYVSVCVTHSDTIILASDLKCVTHCPFQILWWDEIMCEMKENITFVSPHVLDAATI